jgi:hypothetical protein
MAKSRKIVIATAVIAVGVLFVGGFLLNRPVVQPNPVQPSAGANPGTTSVATSPGLEVPAASESTGTSVDSVADQLPEPEEPVAVANAQDAQPDYAYRAATQPMSTEVPPDAGHEWQRAFEKEERDEAWAGPLEAEIRKSLEPEIDLGRFYLANAECRATLCEIRLLARGSLQRAELDQYQSTIFTLPWAARLNPALSSGVDSGDRYESIWIFERRPESRP